MMLVLDSRKDIALSKKKIFNKMYPAINADCVHYVDWHDDTFAFTTEHYELRFYKRKQINENATIWYQQVGVYELCQVKPGIDRENKDDYRTESRSGLSVYVESWLAAEQRYELSLTDPNDRGFQGCNEIYDDTLKKGESLCVWTDDKKDTIDDFEVVNRIVDRALEEKYKKIEAIASSKKYKPGWVYYRMLEPVDVVSSLWKSRGYHFSLRQKASAFCFRYKATYFPEQVKRETEEFLWD